MMSGIDFDDIEELDEAEFWALVDLARKDFAAYRAKLETMQQCDLIGFAWGFEEMMSVLYDPKYHGDRYTEDEMEGWYAFILARGKDIYEEVLDDPAACPRWNKDEVGLQILLQAGDVHLKRFGEDLPPLE